MLLSVTGTQAYMSYLESGAWQRSTCLVVKVIGSLLANFGTSVTSSTLRFRFANKACLGELCQKKRVVNNESDTQVRQRCSKI